ncbi:MAG: nucleoside deaminase [Desulfosalsimonadaceae bacterium]
MSMLANTDEKFMTLALEEARKALAAGDFPVGCVIADGRQVVASGFRIASRGAMANEIDHAEIVALRHLVNSPLDIPKERLCLYSTLEPCLMCFGAILISGIHRIVYAFEDVMGGGTRCNRYEMPPLYRDIDLAIVGNVLREESIALMRSFFSNPDNRYLRDTFFARYAMGHTAASAL